MSDEATGIFEQAAAILRQNDQGGYAVPTHGLYPFQWSWDSAITALGWLRFDEPRAWLEAETMFGGQWDNGMLPHILFHRGAESYFPGPQVWGAGQSIPSSAISQPPVWATAIRLMFERATDRPLAQEQLNRLVPKLVAYHRWWYRERDPEGTGLVCSYHPWESGMDNSPAWDQPLRAVPPVQWAYERRDTSLISKKERPSKEEYDRYLYLVDFFKHSKFDSAVIYRDCPYRVLDIGIISILHRATEDLIALCAETGSTGEATELGALADRTRSAVGGLWRQDKGHFVSRDARTGQDLDDTTSATPLPLFGGLASEDQAATLGRLLEGWLDKSAYGVSSIHPSSPKFEPQRYWRGPIWLHINWMIADGLARYGRADLAERVREASQRCIAGGRFHESYNAETGEGSGGATFTWSAAISLHWLID